MHTASHWSTSSFGHTAQMLPTELNALGEHLHLCRRITGPLFALQCGVEAVHRFLAARLVTTVVVLALTIGGAALAW